MKLTKVLAIILLIFITFPLRAGNEICDEIRNNTFSAGESITFKVFYTVAGMYVGAGEAVFNSSLEKLNNKPVRLGEKNANVFPEKTALKLLPKGTGDTSFMASVHFAASNPQFSIISSETISNFKAAVPFNAEKKRSSEFCQSDC